MAGGGSGGGGAVGEKLDLIKALSNEVVSVIRDLVRTNPLFREQTQYFSSRVRRNCCRESQKLVDTTRGGVAGVVTRGG